MSASRFIVTLLCAVTLAGSALAQQQGAAAPEPKWLKDSRGCKFLNPTPKPKESITWSGDCVDGYVSGEGVLQFLASGKPGARYEGTLQRGHLTGRGKLTTPDGVFYDGDWVDGKQEGYGKYVAADGSIYEGGWTAGQPNGFGSYHPAAGDPVRGRWENGKLVERYTDK